MLISKVICFFEINETSEDIFSILPAFLNNLPESEDLVRCASTRAETTLMVCQIFLNYRTTPFFQALSIGLTRKAEQRDAPVVVAVSLIPLFKDGNNHPRLPLLRCLPRDPGHLTHTSQPENSISI